MGPGADRIGITGFIGSWVEGLLGHFRDDKNPREHFLK